MSFPNSKADTAASGARRLHETAVELDVPRYHADALGIVWHGHSYEYLDVGSMLLRTPVAILGRLASSLP